MQVNEMARLAVKHHHLGRDFEYYAQVISKRPSAWIQECKNWEQCEKLEAKSRRKSSFTERQKELIELLKNSLNGKHTATWQT